MPVFYTPKEELSVNGSLINRPRLHCGPVDAFPGNCEMPQLKQSAFFSSVVDVMDIVSCKTYSELHLSKMLHRCTNDMKNFL